jgi:hypothetical protein
MWLLILLASLNKRKMTLAQVRALAKSAGFPDPDLAAAVAMAESGCNPMAVGDNGNSIGLWQINLPAHPEYGELALMDPQYNAKAAFAVSSHGTNWNPWTMYRNGGYKKYMPKPAVATPGA